MRVSLKTEQRRSHTAVASFRPWVRRAEGCWGTRQVRPCWQVPVKPRRPPSLPLICEVFSADSSFSVFKETPMASAIHFKKLNGYRRQAEIDEENRDQSRSLYGLYDLLQCVFFH